MMDTQLDQMRDQLVVTLKSILNHKTHTLLFEENYRWCHNLVLHKRVRRKRETASRQPGAGLDSALLRGEG
jgi:hypothetical protein